MNDTNGKGLPSVVRILSRQYFDSAVEVEVSIIDLPGSKAKQCFDNAYKYVGLNSGAVYVVGFYLLHGIPIEHAWVKNGSEYYEVTLKFQEADSRYFSLYELDYVALSCLVCSSQSPPGLYECAKYKARPNNSTQ